jgi:hypothetical protein
MQIIAIFLLLYATGNLAMSGQCDGDRLSSRHQSAQANWRANDEVDSSYCCDTCFCCSILIVTEEFCPTKELQIAGFATVLLPVLTPIRWTPSIYHPPKAA